MTPQDFVVTPLFLLLIYFSAYLIRNKVSDKNTQRYFIPALTLKMIGAIAVGLIYQFYYTGGDTFNYFHHGSRHIWEAFLDSPVKAFQLIFADGTYQPGTYDYASKIWYYRDLPSYFVIRVAGVFDLLTFHTYSATALLFACYSFGGLWAMYLSFYSFYNKLHREFAAAIFFIPSVFFWGSGLLKDTITLGALAWAFYAVVQLFFAKRSVLVNALILLLSCWIIYSIKIYILLCFLPAVIVWTFLAQLPKIKSIVVKSLLLPFILIIAALISYWMVLEVGEENARYNLDNLTYTAESTARWLSYVSEVEGGSGYSLGDYDYSPSGIIKKIPAAVNVTLFRPYLTEVSNPVMLMAALESLMVLLVTLYVFGKSIWNSALSIIWKKPEIIFCLLFSLSFAFAIGFSTYNFGSLVRYKIPLIPFYLVGLFILNYYSKRSRRKG